MNAEDFRPLLQRACALASGYLHGVSERRVGALDGRDGLVDEVAVALPEHGEPPPAVLDHMAALAARGTCASGSPRYFGFVVGGTLPVALASDWLVSAWDQNAGIHVLSPLAATLEEVAGQWLLDLFDLPRECGIGFVTGCQMANFTGLAAARNAVLRRAGWDVEVDGLAGAPRINLIASAEAHVTIDVALRFLGFGTRCVHRVATDDQGRMCVDALIARLATLEGPTIVCAQAGNVNTGAFDPLREVGEAARVHGAWLHVDAAFGLWARASRQLRQLADGIELADSWATDAHKWLNVPYDCGVIAVRDRDAHRAAMTSSAAYLVKAENAAQDAVDWVPEFSRRARGVPVYAALRALGREGIAGLIDRCCAHASEMANLLAAQPGVEILNNVVLNQVLVRFGDDDETTRRVIASVQQEGTCWLGGTNWQGRCAMRVSFSNWATTTDDVTRSAAVILRMHRNLHARA